MFTQHHSHCDSHCHHSDAFMDTGILLLWIWSKKLSKTKQSVHTNGSACSSVRLGLLIDWTIKKPFFLVENSFICWHQILLFINNTRKKNSSC
jgi:hypothetical protein